MNRQFTFILLLLAIGWLATRAHADGAGALLPPVLKKKAQAAGTVKRSFTNEMVATWNGVESDTYIIGYRLLGGTNRGGPYFKSWLTTNLMLTVTNITTNFCRWFFVVVARDAIGNESDYSNEAHWRPYDPVLVGFHLGTMPPTNCVVQASDDLRNFYFFTNATASGVDLPLMGGNKFFRAGTSSNSPPIKVQLTPLYFQPQ